MGHDTTQFAPQCPLEEVCVVNEDLCGFLLSGRMWMRSKVCPNRVRERESVART